MSQFMSRGRLGATVDTKHPTFQAGSSLTTRKHLTADSETVDR